MKNASNKRQRHRLGCNLIVARQLPRGLLLVAFGVLLLVEQFTFGGVVLVLAKTSSTASSSFSAAGRPDGQQNGPHGDGQKSSAEDGSSDHHPSDTTVVSTDVWHYDGSVWTNNDGAGGGGGGASSDDEAESSEDDDDDETEEWSNGSVNSNQDAAIANSTQSKQDSSTHEKETKGQNQSSGQNDGTKPRAETPRVTTTGSRPQENNEVTSGSVGPSRSTKRIDSSVDSSAPAAADPNPSRRPLETLEKLQQMLDETDYITSKSNDPRSNRAGTNRHAKGRQLPSGVPRPAPLWTSKDRSKYKKQNQRQRRAREQGADSGPSPRSSSSSGQKQLSADDEVDDGLGYTLPTHLPVYFSDAEDSDADAETSERQQPLAAEASSSEGKANMHPQESGASPPSGVTLTPPPPETSRSLVPGATLAHPHPYYYPPSPEHYMQRYPQYPYHPNGYPYPYLSPYGPYAPQQQQQMYSGQYAPWAGFVPGPYAQPQLQSPRIAPGVSVPPRVASGAEARKESPSSVMQLGTRHPALATTHAVDMAQVALTTEQPQSFAEASSKLNFDSIQKISLMLVTTALACYSAVSPRTLPLTEYNLHFYENVRIVWLSTIVPAFYALSVFNARENDINTSTSVFFTSFTLGYCVTFVVEILVTTIIRLGVFCWLERGAFALSPKVPVPILPWVLRETRYKPKRITLFVADFATSCVACPIIEEYIKLKVIEWTVKLPRNFDWVTKSSPNGKRKRLVAEAIRRRAEEREVTTASHYVNAMLAASLGLKLCDAGRRILLYTKPYHENKSFYAFCRGIFPIHELCGTVTALALAKRDLLGVRMPLWKMLLPSVVIHGMANFRGMKPIFKWNSATPWSEMQLSPWNVPDASTLPQLLSKGFAKLMWVIILSRVLGYCIKNYYMVNRQAVKRTTTYAGNHAAFSAELATAEMLKKK